MPLTNVPPLESPAAKGIPPPARKRNGEREERETINSAVKDLIPSLARKPAGFLSFREADANCAYVKDTKKLHYKFSTNAAE